MPPNQGKVYRQSDGPWQAARAWLYAHSAPGPLSAPLIRPKENYRSVYVLMSNGAIAQFDKALANGNVVQKPSPDALAWRLETVDGKPYICYSSNNAIEALDAETLRETSIVLPDPLPSAVGWVNARNFKGAPQPAVFLSYLQSFLRPWAWASRVGSLYALAGQLPLEAVDPIVLAADAGASGWPVLGQAGVTTRPPGPIRSATLHLGQRQLVGPPLLQAEGDSYAAYVMTFEVATDRSLHCQKWMLPPLADDAGLTQQWSDASSGAQVDTDIGYMERALTSHLLPPAFMTLSLARQMLEAGVAQGGPV